MPGFLSDTQVQSQVQDAIGVQQFDANTRWPGICTAANATAYSEIVAAFVKRGYTVAQVSQWDQGAAWQADLALYFAIVRGGLAKDYDTKFLALLDRRPELMTAPLTVNGVAVLPAIGSVAVGELSTQGPPVPGQALPTPPAPTPDTFRRDNPDQWPWQWAEGQGLWPGPNGIDEST